MSGRGRGGWGWGRCAQLPFEKFPEIEDLGKAQYSASKKQLIMLSMDLQKFWKASPYYYEPANKFVKTGIERYLDRQQGATNKKRRLEHYIFMDADHLPGELAKAGGGARVAKNVQWDIDFDEAFKKLEEKVKGKEHEARMMRKAEEEEEDDDDDSEVEDDDEEEVEDDDDDDYILREMVDDDEDDYNDNQDDGNDIDDTY